MYRTDVFFFSFFNRRSPVYFYYQSHYRRAILPFSNPFSKNRTNHEFLKSRLRVGVHLKCRFFGLIIHFRVFRLKNTDLDFPKRIHGPRLGLHVRVYSFVVCGFVRCGKNRNSGRYAAISVMVSTVFIYDRPFAFADGGRGKPSV